MNRQTTWSKLIYDEMLKHSDCWAYVVSSTLTGDQLEKSFDCGFGLEEGEPFTVWTEKRVYFPVCYDGAEWCGSVSRHPDGNPTEHQGG